jgi:glycosyltransferase involved in cell wall biosynthesis
VYCISSDGKKYFREHVPYKYHNKIKLSYVGVDTAINNSNNLTPSGRYVLVSASHTADFKRVHLIPDLIKDVSIPMEWIHFGAGVNDNLIKQKIINLPSNITVTLKGNVDNTELMKFYNSNYVNAFISLSKTEGLPISMMECAMFGAPIFACDVGGIKDIVSPDKGMLIDANLEVEDMREKFLQFMKIDYNRSFIMDAAHQKFDYRKNYSELYNEFKR